MVGPVDAVPSSALLRATKRLTSVDCIYLAPWLSDFWLGLASEDHQLKVRLKAGSRPGCRLCSRYLFLLAGGGALAVAAMGAFAVLVFIPALCTVVLIHSLGPQDVHRPTFLFQMTWQTLCHLGLHYTEYYLQEAPSTR